MQKQPPPPPHQNHMPQFPQPNPFMFNPIQPHPFPSTVPISTDYIQKRLDENKQLILAILDNQNLGKLAECAEYQAMLQRNLLQLAAIADSQQVPAARPHMPPAIPYMQQPSGFHPRAPIQLNPQQLPEQLPQSVLQQPQPFGFQSHMGLQPSLNNGSMHTLRSDGTPSGSGNTAPSAANPSEFTSGSVPSSGGDDRGSKQDTAPAPESASGDKLRGTGEQQGSGDQESHEK